MSKIMCQKKIVFHNREMGLAIMENFIDRMEANNKNVK